MPTANEQLLDTIIKHQIGLRKVSAQLARDLQALLNKHDRRLLRLLSTIGQNSTARQVEGVLRVVNRANRSAYQDVEAAFIKAMEEVATYEVGFQGNALSEVMTADVLVLLGLTGLSRSEILRIVENTPIDGAKLSEYVAGAANGRYNRIRDAVRREHAAGGPGVKEAITTAIVGTATAAYMDGVLGVSRRSLEMMSRTVQAGIIHGTRSLLYKRNDHLFEGVLWVSVLDSRTSVICQNLDGKVFPVNRGPRPPMHPNCRSIVVPIISDWRSLGLNENISPELQEALAGDVPERLTYPTWLARQPAKVQDEVLGPTRGKMYRKGEVSFDRFVDKSGRRYTLDELRQREGLT